MKGPWQAETATVDTRGTPPPGVLSSTQQGRPGTWTQLQAAKR